MTASSKERFVRKKVLTQQLSRTRPPWLLPVVVGFIAIIGIAVAYFIIAGPNDANQSADQGNTGEDGGVVDVVEQGEADQIDLSYVERRDAADPLAIGDADAPVTMVVFSDYQCPFCASWSDETLPAMMEYVDDDLLRIEWRDLNVFGPESERASKAAFAAALQDKFWEYHHELFAGGQIRDPSDLSEDALVELAADLDLDTDQFADDMHSDQVAETILENQRLGTDLGAYSTPAFVLGGEPMMGAQPTEVFIDAMDAAVAAARQ